MKVKWNTLVSEQELEQWMRIAKDTKKEFTLNKDTGQWQWFNRGDESGLSEGFDSFSQCLKDAVEPYLQS